MRIKSRRARGFVNGAVIPLNVAIITFMLIIVAAPFGHWIGAIHRLYGENR
jgi:hypothetical protein